jgi:hypothetical protein
MPPVSRREHAIDLPVGQPVTVPPLRQASARLRPLSSADLKATSHAIRSALRRLPRRQGTRECHCELQRKEPRRTRPRVPGVAIGQRPGCMRAAMLPRLRGPRHAGRMGGAARCAAKAVGTARVGRPTARMNGRLARGFEVLREVGMRPGACVAARRPKSCDRRPTLAARGAAVSDVRSRTSTGGSHRRSCFRAAAGVSSVRAPTQTRQV